MLDLLHAWLLVPALLGLSLLGLGLLLERLAGLRLPTALVAPAGLAALIVVAATMTATASAARATVPVVAVLAIAGLVVGRRRRPGRAAVIAVVGVFLVYGAPVLLSGNATFAGYLRLDDTATWLAFSDQVIEHGRSLTDVPPSTYRDLMLQNLPIGYPLGAFMPLAVTSRVAGIDAAWAFAPLLSVLAALLACGLHALLGPFGLPPRRRAVVVFVAAQPALLYGYAQWGGIKELTVAVLAALLGALVGGATTGTPRTIREALPLGIAIGAVMAVIGPGGVVFAAPAMLVVAWRLAWQRRTDGPRAGPRGALRGAGVLVVVAAFCTLPTLVALSGSLDYGHQFLDEARDRATRFGNLPAALSGWQLGGVWTVPDFRDRASWWPTGVFLVVAAAAAVLGTREAVRRRAGGLLLYVTLVLLAVAGGWATGASPWLLGKALAIAAPALPLLALAGAAMLQRSVPRRVVLGVLLVGVVGSNLLIYSNVTLAPRDRLGELERVGELVADQGPTFDNQYEVYSSRHFLRAGQTVQPAELRSVTLPLADGTYLTKPAAADIDGFPPSTLAPFRTLVVPRAPTQSRPSSEWVLQWRGRYYEVYRRANVGTLVQHVPLGESRARPFCGRAQNGPAKPLCSVLPVEVPNCSVIERLGLRAARAQASLVAAVRPGSIVIRGDDVRWPAGWLHDGAGHSLSPTAAGVATSSVGFDARGRYRVWLGGTFARGLEVRVDGRRVGAVRRTLGTIAMGEPVGEVELEAGVHRIELRYPQQGAAPGDADDDHLTSLTAVSFEPRSPAARLLTVPPAAARTLCGQPLDWVDLVR